MLHSTQPFQSPVASTQNARFNIKNNEFVHTVYFVCFVQFSQQTNNIFEHNIHQFIFLMEAHYILCELQIVSLHITKISVGLQRVNKRILLLSSEYNENKLVVQN